MNPAYRINSPSLTLLPRPGRNKAYRAWIRKQPCAISGKAWNIDFAHTGPRGLGQKANDLDGVPLNREVHRQYHAWGRTKFEQHYRISIDQIILELQQRAVEDGVSLECEPKKIKRKPLGRAASLGYRKSDSAERSA